MLADTIELDRWTWKRTMGERPASGQCGAKSSTQRQGDLPTLGDGFDAEDRGDHRGALEIWHVLAKAGNVQAASILGTAFLMGNGIDQDFGQAECWLRFATDHGDAAAAHFLGDLYGVLRADALDYPEAARMYALADERGSLLPLDRLGCLHRDGKGVPQDCGRAASYFQKGADVGRKWCQFYLAKLHMEGRGITYSPAQAAKWFTLAGGQGHPHACLELASLYSQGIGVLKDIDKALQWYQAAIDKAQAGDEGVVSAAKHGIEGIERMLGNATGDSNSDREASVSLIERLRGRGKETIRQRDEWKRRALTAETRVANLEASNDELVIETLRKRDEWERRALVAEALAADFEAKAAKPEVLVSDKRFDALRRFLAREFHPDHSKVEGIDKIVRAEIFKHVWPKIEEIARS